VLCTVTPTKPRIMYYTNQTVVGVETRNISLRCFFAGRWQIRFDAAAAAHVVLVDDDDDDDAVDYNFVVIKCVSTWFPGIILQVWDGDMRCSQKVSNQDFMTSSNIDFSTIGYWRDTVVCPSLCLWRSLLSNSLFSLFGIVALRVGVACRRWKCYRRVPGRGLPLPYFRHICCRMYRLASNGEKAEGR